MIADMKTRLATFIFATFALIALLLAACGGGNSSGSAGTIAPLSQSSVAPTNSVAPTALPTSSESTEPPSESSVPTSSVPSQPESSDPTDGSASEADSTSETSQPTAGLAALYKDEVDDLISETEQIRGLKFLTPPKVILLDRESFTERVVVDWMLYSLKTSKLRMLCINCLG